MQLVKKRCYKCGGTGTIICRRCKGTAYYNVEKFVQWGDYIPEGYPTYNLKIDCHKCNYTGREECPECKGKGEIMLNSSEEIEERKKYDNYYKLYKRFDIDPVNIDRDIFKKVQYTSGYYSNYEWVRQTILDAFEEMDNNPKKYAKPFTTMDMLYEIDYSKPNIKEIPEKEGNRTIEELISIANVLADMADWVHLSLEWAHIIANNKNAFRTETGRNGWDYVCEDDKEINRFRPRITSLVIWKNGYVRYSASGKTHFVPGIISGGDRPFKEKIPFCYYNCENGMLVVK